jgi:hypothetical protein
MSHPNAGDQALAVAFSHSSQNRSDLAESAVYAALQLIALGSLVPASTTPVADVLDYVNANLNASGFVTLINQRLNSRRERQ